MQYLYCSVLRIVFGCFYACGTWEHDDNHMLCSLVKQRALSSESITIAFISLSHYLKMLVTAIFTSTVQYLCMSFKVLVSPQINGLCFVFVFFLCELCVYFERLCD